MFPEHEPDFNEKLARFVFGFLGGAILGFILTLQLEVGPSLEGVVCMMGSALACAAGAVKFGDGFWKGIFLFLSFW